MFGRW